MPKMNDPKENVYTEDIALLETVVIDVEPVEVIGTESPKPKVNEVGSSENIKKKDENSYEEKIWNFVNKENESNYKVTNECSTIEFPERVEANNCCTKCFQGRKTNSLTSSLMQLSKHIGNTHDPISFMVKIGNLGKNRYGNGDSGIEVGFAKTMQDNKSDGSERMINGIWYDVFNGGIYNNQQIPQEYTSKAAQDDVVEWRVEDCKGEDDEDMHKFTLYLNNDKMGKSILVTKNVTLYPSINVASTNGEVTINVSGMGYSTCQIDYPKKQAEGSCSSCCNCKIPWLRRVIQNIGEAAVLWAIVRLFLRMLQRLLFGFRLHFIIAE